MSTTSGNRENTGNLEFLINPGSSGNLCNLIGPPGNF